LTVTRTSDGPLTASSDVSVDTGGNFEITTIIMGNIAQSNIDFANAVETALSNSGYVVIHTINEVVTFDTAGAGFVDDAVNFDMPTPFDLEVITQGTGPIEISFPPEVLLEAGDEMIKGGKQKIYTLLKSGANIFISSSEYSN
jgi:hypothetical protein